MNPTLKQAIQLGLSLAPQGQGIDPAVQAIEKEVVAYLNAEFPGLELSQPNPNKVPTLLNHSEFRLLNPATPVNGEKTMPTLQVQLRSAYGRDLIYPINAHAKTFTQFTGRKTLSEADLRLIKSLGFKIEWIPQSLTEFHDKE